MNQTWPVVVMILSSLLPTVNTYYILFLLPFRYFTNNITYLEDESILLKKYCPVSNKNDKFFIVSPLPMARLMVRV